MAKKFKKGDRVASVEYDEYSGHGGELRYDEYGDYAPFYGTVTDELSDNRVLVKWDKCSWLDSEPFSQKVLKPENELKTKYSELEKAFKAVEKKVQSKIKAAAKNISDAQKLAKKAGLNLNELTKAIGPLETAMDRAGWQTSSWACPGF